MLFDHDDFWVFGYGSLMWRPDFPHVEAHRAWIHGYHRALCALSTGHRGTRDRPSLIVGLDRGGSCLGRAYRVAPRDAEAVTAYLRGREMKSGVYEPRRVTVRLNGGLRARAVTFAVCRESPLYTGKLPLKRQVELVLQGRGRSGSGLEYLESTVAHLDEMGVPCAHLRTVLVRARFENRRNNS